MPASLKVISESLEEPCIRSEMRINTAQLKSLNALVTIPATTVGEPIQLSRLNSSHQYVELFQQITDIQLI